MKNHLREIIIGASGLTAAAICAAVYSFLLKGFWLYELVAFLVLVAFYCLFVFIPGLFKDFAPKQFKNEKSLFGKISLFLSKKENQVKVLFCSVAVILNVLYIVRYMYAHDWLQDVVKLSTYVTSWGNYSAINTAEDVTLMAPWQVAISALTNCWIVGAVIIVVGAQFLDSDVMRSNVKWVATPIVLLGTTFLPYILMGTCGDIAANGFSPRALIQAINYGLLGAFCLYRWTISPSVKPQKTLVYGSVVAAFLVLLISINDYLPQNLIGMYLNNVPNPHDFNITHRIFLYIAFLLPILYFLLLYPFDLPHRRFYLFLIACLAMYSYASITRIEVWEHFYTMPLHLCNTAMYIMPLTLIFMSYGLFYFTMFINVIGAFMAMLMPNYNEALPVLSSRIMQFYNNHWYAFFMPVLIILLGIFRRPKMKYFGYSMAGFAVYFILVAFLDIYYKGTASYWITKDPSFGVPNFFFLNERKDIAEKLGTWAEKIFDKDQIIKVNGYSFTLRVPYLIGFFTVYVGLAFAMWYIYELLFKGTDQLVLLREKSGAYRANKIEFAKAQTQRRALMSDEEKMVLDEHPARLTIEHLTKRYGSAKTNAVTDFSLDITGGKIYGFLGKNGAGKSTIIKAVVGMHGFNEGTISVCGYDVANEPVQAKQQIGFVPDNYALYESLTGRQYINYIADLYGVTPAEREARLPALLDRLEMKEQFNRQMKTYSHGMKQKITIIGALIHDPKIWILDEPMTGVDPNSIFQIKECMREHAEKGNIVFFSSHLIDVVQNLCDEIIIIKHGKLIMTSSMEDLTKQGVDLEALFLEKTADSEQEAQALIKEEDKFGK
jgi:ABC-2 type transport system ATP-binding protein